MLVARDIMHSKVTRVTPGMLVGELASLLLSKGYSGAPVVDEKGTLIGAVSFADIAAYAVARTEMTPNRERPSYYRDLWMEEDIADGFIVEEYDLSVKVEDIMTPAVYKVEETTTVADVVELMKGARIHRVFVCNNDKLLGIITTMDLIGLIPKLLKHEAAAH